MLFLPEIPLSQTATRHQPGVRRGVKGFSFFPNSFPLLLRRDSSPDPPMTVDVDGGPVHGFRRRNRSSDPETANLQNLFSRWVSSLRFDPTEETHFPDSFSFLFPSHGSTTGKPEKTAAVQPQEVQAEKPKLRICCACPETKSVSPSRPVWTAFPFCPVCSCPVCSCPFFLFACFLQRGPRQLHCELRRGAMQGGDRGPQGQLHHFISSVPGWITHDEIPNSFFFFLPSPFVSLRNVCETWDSKSN